MLSFTPQVDKENLWFGIIPRISFADKETYVESETKQYDMVSSKMLPLFSLFLELFRCHFDLQLHTESGIKLLRNLTKTWNNIIKVARLDFLGLIPPKFEH